MSSGFLTHNNIPSIIGSGVLMMQLYDHLHHRCTDDEIHTIVSEAVALEKEFLIDALPCSLIGINADVSSRRSSHPPFPCRHPYPPSDLILLVLISSRPHGPGPMA